MEFIPVIVLGLFRERFALLRLLCARKFYYLLLAAGYTMFRDYSKGHNTKK